jgi:hypothetical protein
MALFERQFGEHRVFLRGGWVRFSVFLVALVSADIAAAAVPTLTLKSSRSAVYANTTFSLTWSSTGATSCAASGAWTGSKAISGTQRLGPITSSKTYTLVCKGPGGSVKKSATVSVVAKPVINFSASPTSIVSGKSSTLSWSVTKATSCTATNGWTGIKPLSGKQSTGPLTASRTYGLGCRNGAAPIITVARTVTVTSAGPTLSFSASPTTVTSGGTTKLAWSSSGATSCTASGGWTGTKATSGTYTSAALTANKSFTLACTGSGKTVSKTVAVTVQAATGPTLSFSASPTTVTSGGTTKLTWSSSGATSCTASGGWTGTKATSGTYTSAALTANKSFTLACTGSGKTVSKTVAVTVQSAPSVSVSLNASAKSVVANGTVTLSWSSTGATSCTASGGWSGSRAVSGSASVGPIANDTTYTLNCTNGGSSAVSMTTIVVREARLSWQAPTQNTDGSPLTNLAGYKVLYGTSPKQYSQTVSVSGASTVSRTIALSPGTWYFAVKAVDSAGKESSPSNEVSKVIP